MRALVHSPRFLAGSFSLLLLLLPIVAAFYKLVVLDYTLEGILPRKEYTVSLDMTADGGERRVRIATFLPRSDRRQRVEYEVEASDAVFFASKESVGLDQRMTWVGSRVPDGASLRVAYRVIPSGMRFEIDESLRVPDSYPRAVRDDLLPDEFIQVDDPEIRRVLAEIGADTGSIASRLRKIFDFTAGLSPRPFKGTTDALTALRLGEASCNGKSRLFVALARATGIPARLVGGLILEPGSKKTSHQWVEAYVGGHWVPFGPTNDHFAEIPAHYLTLYHGDRSLFSHTADLNFDYRFNISTRLVPSEEARSSFGGWNVWDLFARIGLPFSLLQTVLMLPIGALVVVLFRNVVGVPTFGTFLPALIAASASETGLLWGLASIVIVTTAVVLARRVLQRLQLLHSPTLAILLAVVVLSMIATSFVADLLGIAPLARISYFPIAVMAIASERMYLALAEQGLKKALVQFGGTLLVVLGCYVVMSSLAIQVLVSGFPEVLLVVIAANIYLGQWVGMRVLEYWRFRGLMQGGRA